MLISHNYPQSILVIYQKINSTARLLPFLDSSLDRVIALESAQHFNPIGDFISESNRVLKENGILALAIPTAIDNSSLSNLGILKFTWSSEHYSEKIHPG